MTSRANVVLMGLVLCGVVAGLPSAEASFPFITEELLQEGVRFYQKGDYPRAIHELSKVLMLDPDNKTAKEYLRKMGVQGHRYGENRYWHSRLDQVNRELALYENQLNVVQEEAQRRAQEIQALRSEKQELLSELTLKEKEAAFLLDKVEAIQRSQADLALRAQAYHQSIYVLEKAGVQKDREKRRLVEEKENLRRAFIAREADQRQLQKKFQDFREKARRGTSQLQRALAGVENEARKKSRQIARLHTDMFSMKNRLRETLVLNREQKQNLRSVKKKFKALEDELLSTRLAWKNSHIGYERELTRWKQEAEEQRFRVRQTDQKAHRRIQKIRDVLRQKAVEADYLSDRLLMARYKLAHAETALAQKEKKIHELKVALLDLQKQLMDRENARAALGQEEGAWNAALLKRQDRQIAELKALILQYKERLAQLEKEKDAGEVDRFIDEE